MTARTTPLQSDEIWKVVPFDTRYEVSNKGRVRGGVWGAVKKVCYQNGYPCVGFYHGVGKTRVHAIHRLVAFAFHGNPPTEKHEVAHWDGSKTNNAPENLRWATRQENLLDQVRHGTHFNPRMYGKDNHKSKMTAEKVREARDTYAAGGVTQAELARKYGISGPGMRMILLRKHWAQVA